MSVSGCIVYAAAAAIFAYFGRLGVFLWFSLAVTLHECGHLLAARALGLKVSAVCVLPFCARIALLCPAQPLDELALAASGPFFSLFTATVCAGAMHFFPQAAVLECLLTASLALALVNLLPAFPLDGGRIVGALLALFMGAGAAFDAAFAVSLATGALLLGYAVYALCCGFINVSAFVLGGLIIIGSFSHRSRRAVCAAGAALAQGGRLRQGRALRGMAAAVCCDCTAEQALRSIRGAPYAAVLDGDMRALGTLGQGDLIKAVTDGRGGCRVDTLLSRAGADGTS